jgi:pyruvate ferredoxin oxidoreductase gamma subunit
MAGIVTQEKLILAIQEEFSHLHLANDLIEKNVEVAGKVFAGTEPIEIRPSERQLKMEMAEVRYNIPLISSPSVLHMGNAVARHTGSWRVERPVIDTDVCTRCGLCFVRCPDGAIALDDEEFPVIDYDHCKGCMICHQICPLHAIESEKETRAW